MSEVIGQRSGLCVVVKSSTSMLGFRPSFSWTFLIVFVTITPKMALFLRYEIVVATITAKVMIFCMYCSILVSHNLFIGGVCMPASGNGVCQIDARSRDECFPSRFAGKLHCITGK